MFNIANSDTIIDHLDTGIDTDSNILNLTANTC